MELKSYISAVLRKLHLLAAAENIRYRSQKKRFENDNNIFREQNPGLALPPDFFIYETYRLNLKEYYYDGQATAAEIISFIQKHRDLHQPDTRVLDWGCGPARIVRHLPALLPQAEVHGSDYNEEYINWCRQSLKEIQFSLNKIDPPMNYPASFFDAIIGISVFTHLSAASHANWINELYRITKPGGIIFLTTQGTAFRSKLTNAERLQFDKGLLVSRQNIKEGNRLYSSFQPHSFMKQLLAGKFAIADFFPAEVNNDEPGQDTWLLQKTPVA
jgi:SAM-dependent methyltransferase